MRKLRNNELGRISISTFKKITKTPIIVVLDNIRSLNNIGSVFRTSDAFLVEKIYLCGITATPPHRDIHKTALGATESVEWEYKALLGKQVATSFADYCENNPDGFRIGDVAKRVIRDNHFAEGFYFYAKNEKYLMLAKIALGGQIRRVIKYVSQQDLHK